MLTRRSMVLDARARVVPTESRGSWGRCRATRLALFALPALLALVALAVFLQPSTARAEYRPWWFRSPRALRPTTITLARHGETIENRLDFSQGQRYGTISRHGLYQATRLATRLRNEKFDVIYCSDSARTRRTLGVLLRYHPRAKVIYTPEIRERNKGAFEGWPHSLIRKFEELKAKQGVPADQVQPIYGESTADLNKRAMGFYERLLAMHRGQNVLVITHQGVMKEIEKQMGIADPQPDNTAVTKVRVDLRGRTKVLVADSTRHLREETP